MKLNEVVRLLGSKSIENVVIKQKVIFITSNLLPLRCTSANGELEYFFLILQTYPISVVMRYFSEFITNLFLLHQLTQNGDHESSVSTLEIRKSYTVPYCHIM